MQAGTCPNCGSAVQPGAEFCTVCGTRLAGLGQPAAYGSTGVPPPPPPPVNLPPGGTTAPIQPLPPSTGAVPPAGSLWPPSAPAYTAPPAAARRRPEARVVALVGAVAVAAGAFLPWVRFNFDFTAFKIPLKFLLQAESGSTSANIGIVLVVLAALGLVLSFFPAVSVGRRILGVTALAVPVVFVIQLLRFRGADVFSNLGAGAYIAAIGGLLLAVG
jgi:hypothetical protein